MAGVLIGTLGWTADEAADFIEAVSTAAGDDYARKRREDAYSTAKRLEDGENIQGLPTLAEGVGEQVVKKLLDFIAPKVEFGGFSRNGYGPGPSLVDFGEMPLIIAKGRQLRAISDDAVYALTTGNEPPVLFLYGGIPARLVRDRHDQLRVETMGRSAMRGRLARVANWGERTAKGLREFAPPEEVADDVLSLGNWPWPELDGISEIPILRVDGSICTNAGYDGASRLYYSPPQDLNIPTIPEHPSPAELHAAAALIREPFEDFPFAGPADLAAACSALFTTIARPCIQGSTPLHLFDKPKVGTGASLLADAIGTIVLGKAPVKMTAPSEDDEWRKRITSFLLEGSPLAIFDNVDRPLASGHLSSVITDIEWGDRLLGGNKNVCLANRATWIATGNNLRTRSDIARRSVWSRLDAKMSRPWERKNQEFRHPQLLIWLRENRGAILAAAFTLVRGWISAGRPIASSPVLGSFEEWSALIGGVLEVAGIDGFLENIQLFYDLADDESTAWGGFLAALWEWYGMADFTTSDLMKDIEEKPDLKAAVPDELADEKRGNLQRRIGRALAARVETRYGPYRLVRAGERKHAAIWRIEGDVE